MVVVVDVDVVGGLWLWLWCVGGTNVISVLVLFFLVELGGSLGGKYRIFGRDNIRSLFLAASVHSTTQISMTQNKSVNGALHAPMHIWA